MVFTYVHVCQLTLAKGIQQSSGLYMPVLASKVDDVKLEHVIRVPLLTFHNFISHVRPSLTYGVRGLEVLQRQRVCTCTAHNACSVLLKLASQVYRIGIRVGFRNLEPQSTPCMSPAHRCLMTPVLLTGLGWLVGSSRLI